MERESTPNRKRTRNKEHDKEKEESHDDHNQGKKKERLNNCDDEDKLYEFYDGIGVFDFPWLKEGVIFKSDDYLDEKLSPCSYLDDAPGAFGENLDQSCEENVCVSANLHDQKFDDESFWPLLVDDDLEQIDCIWSCVIDQPLDIGFNKGIDKL